MSNHAKALDRINQLRGFAVEVLSKMISIPTVNPPGENYEEFAHYVKELLESRGVRVELHKVPKTIVEKYYPSRAEYPRYIVLARIGSSEKPVLHLNGHYDVVPPGQGWSRDPFNPVIEAGRLYGRGASDMKGGLASIILALVAIAESNWEPPVTIEASFTPDEETGGETGVKYMLDSGLVKPDYAVVAEPSGVDNIWIGNKGAVWAKIKVYGRQAHGSTPWLGLNAFEKMVELAHLMIKELKPRVEAKKSKYDYGDPRAAKATITLGGEVTGGSKINTVPGYYSFSIDRRVIPEESAEEAAREIIEFTREAEKRIKDLKAEVEIMSSFDATVTDPSSVLVAKLREAVKTITGKIPSTTMCIGGLDTRYFQLKGIQAATYGPGEDTVAHKADEYIELDNIPLVARVYIELASLLGGE